MKKILQVVTYPIDKPRHGGQIRCSQIRNFLIETGYDVTTLSILPKGTSTDLDISIVVPQEFGEQFPYLSDPSIAPLIQDLYIHDWLCTSNGQKQLFEKLQPFDFDVIVIEQPWSFTGIFKVFSDSKANPKFIYSSHNHETPLKRQIIQEFAPDLSALLLEHVVESIRKLEASIVSTSDEIWCVTNTDLESIESTHIAPSILAPNGTRPKVSEPVGPSLTPQEYALFVGSAYPPNLHGFIEMIGSNVYFLPPSFQIVCVGGVAAMLRSWAETLPSPEKFLERVVFFDDATEDELDLLIAHCKIVLLPIKTGSGSNLKTAEALASGKQIVATSKAMRGFERWLAEPGVHIADTQVEFRRKIGQLAIQVEPFEKIDRISSAATPLYWPDCLEPISRGLLSDARNSK